MAATKAQTKPAEDFGQMNAVPDARRLTRRSLLLATTAMVGLSALPISQLAAQVLIEPLPDQTVIPPLPHPAEEFISSIAGSILAVAVSDATADEKKARFQALLIAHAHIPTIAIFSLGQFANRLADEHRQPYFELVSGYIARIFVTHSSNLKGRSVEVTGSHERSEKETLVHSKVWFDSGRALPVIWRVIRTDVGFKVFDVSVNGIWLTFQQRTEFVSIIRKAKGDLNALFAFLTRNG